MTDLQVLAIVLIIGFGILTALMIVAIRLLTQKGEITVARPIDSSSAGQALPFKATPASEESLVHIGAACCEQPLVRVEPNMHVVFGDKENRQIEIAVCNLPQKHIRELAIANETKRQISDYLVKVSNLYALGRGVHTLQVQFSPEVTRQLANGQLDLMRSSLGSRPIAMNPITGRTREIATVATGINPVAAATFAWQVLAILTAQKYLADINKRLSNIEHEVCEIRQFLFDNHESQLVADYDYLRQITSAVASGKLSPEDVVILGGQLEDIERQCMRVMEHSYRGCDRTIADTKSEHDVSLANLDAFVKYAQNQSEQFRLHGRMSLLALSVRITATYLRAALPLNRMIAHNRVEHLRESLTEFENFRTNFSRKLLATCDTIDSRLRREKAIEQTKASARERVEVVSKTLVQHHEELGRALEKVSLRLSNEEAIVGTPQVWYAQIDGSEVKLFGEEQSLEAAQSNVSD